MGHLSKNASGHLNKNDAGHLLHCFPENAFWYRADIAASILEGISPDDPAENNDPVRRCEDQWTTGASWHGDQVNINNRPIYLTAKPELDFDGDDAGNPDYIEVGAPGPFNDPYVIIAAVIKIDVSKLQVIIDKRNPGGGLGWGPLFGIAPDDTVYFYIHDTGHRDAWVQSTATLSGYMAVGAFMDRVNNDLKVYVNSSTADATADCSGVTSSLGNNQDAWIGLERTVGPWDAFDGKICEFFWGWGFLWREHYLQTLIEQMKTRWGT